MVLLNHPHLDGVQIDRPADTVAKHEAAGWLRAEKSEPAGDGEQSDTGAVAAQESPDAGQKSPEPKTGTKPGK